MEGKREKLLTRIADTTKELADCVNSSTPRLEVHRLVHGFRVGYLFIGYFGPPFKFAQMELSSKVMAWANFNVYQLLAVLYYSFIRTILITYIYVCM